MKKSDQRAKDVVAEEREAKAEGEQRVEKEVDLENHFSRRVMS